MRAPGGGSYHLGLADDPERKVMEKRKVVLFFFSFLFLLLLLSSRNRELMAKYAGGDSFWDWSLFDCVMDVVTREGPAEKWAAHIADPANDCCLWQEVRSLSVF